MAKVRRYKTIGTVERKMSATYLYILQNYTKADFERLDQLLDLWTMYDYVPFTAKADGTMDLSTLFEMLGVEVRGNSIRYYRRLVEDGNLFCLDFSDYVDRGYLTPRWDKLKGYAERSLSWARADAGRKGGSRRWIGSKKQHKPKGQGDGVR